jgi:hypothetical protein
VVGTEKASRDQAGRTPRWRLLEARRPGVDIIAGANLARRTVNLPLSIVKIRLWLPGWFVVTRPAASRKNAVPYGGTEGSNPASSSGDSGANSTPRLRLGISKRSPARRVASPGLATNRSGPSQAERRRDDPPTRRHSFPRFTVADCDGARGQPRHWNGASLPLRAPLDRNDRLPCRSLRWSTLQSAFGLGNGPLGLGIVANGLIGDDGATKRAKRLQRIYWLILCRSPFWN